MLVFFCGFRGFCVCGIALGAENCERCALVVRMKTDIVLLLSRCHVRRKKTQTTRCGLDRYMVNESFETLI